MAGIPWRLFRGGSSVAGDLGAGEAHLIWGIPYLLIKVAVGDFGLASLVFLLTGLGALILIPVAAIRGIFGVIRPPWKPVLLYTLVEVADPGSSWPTLNAGSPAPSQGC